MTPGDALNHLLNQDERTQMAGEVLRAEINALREMFVNEMASHESVQDALNDRDETCYELEHKLATANAENERLRAAVERWRRGCFEATEEMARLQAVAEAAKAGGAS